MAIKIKHGVRLTGLQPQMVLALMVIAPIYESYGKDLVVTSGIEGKHSGTSRHYLGYAVDVRTRDFHPAEISAVELELQEALGPEFFVLFETNHFHISFKPTVISA